MDLLIGIARFIRGRLFPPANPSASLSGKTVLLTGGTAGLGFEAAVKYVQLGADSLLLGCRDLERGEKAKQLIEQRTQRTGVVRIYPLDLNSYSSVKSFVEQINTEFPRVHIALLNAGLMRRTYSTSPDGWEETLQVNTLSTVLLGLLLLPKLRESRDGADRARLTFISSGSYRLVKPGHLRVDASILGFLNEEGQFEGRTQYRCSKLLVEYVAKSIANHTRGRNGQIEVIVNSACPGFCRSQLPRDYTSFLERLLKPVVYGIFGRSEEQGSRTLVSATLLGEESHGKWWRDDEYPE